MNNPIDTLNTELDNQVLLEGGEARFEFEVHFPVQGWDTLPERGENGDIYWEGVTAQSYEEDEKGTFGTFFVKNVSSTEEAYQKLESFFSERGVEIDLDETEPDFDLFDKDGKFATW